MRFYTQQHSHYCGIDLHARTMYLCILNQAGAIVLHRNMKSDPESLLNALGQAYLARLEKKHGKGKALSVLAHKLARAVYCMLHKKEAFDMQRFLNR